MCNLYVFLLGPHRPPRLYKRRWPAHQEKTIGRSGSSRRDPFSGRLGSQMVPFRGLRSLVHCPAHPRLGHALTRRGPRQESQLLRLAGRRRERFDCAKARWRRAPSPPADSRGPSWRTSPTLAVPAVQWPIPPGCTFSYVYPAARSPALSTTSKNPPSQPPSPGVCWSRDLASKSRQPAPPVSARQNVAFCQVLSGSPPI